MRAIHHQRDPDPTHPLTGPTRSPAIGDPYPAWLWLGIALAGPAIGLVFPRVVAPYVIVRHAGPFQLWCLAAGFGAGLWALSVAWFTLHRTNRQLARLATQDPLTGLANLRRFHAGLTSVLGRGGQASLIMGDLDHFKRVNDEHGHLEGDRVLVAVASALSRSVRDNDLVARIGGEEFAILLPDADLAVAAAIAERIRRTVEALPWGVTISLGVALYPDHATLPIALVKAADDATYHAKRAGRNQVAVWQDVAQSS